MPILAAEPTEPQPEPITQDTVDAILATAKAHCAPTTWDRFARSLLANDFPFKVAR